MSFQDVFPATVVVAPEGLGAIPGSLHVSPPTAGTYLITDCRVIVYNGSIIVAQDNSSGPKIVFSESIVPESFSKSGDIRSTLSYVTTTSGKMLAFRRESSCACGSRLRSWNPFRTMRSSQDPTS